MKIKFGDFAETTAFERFSPFSALWTKLVSYKGDIYMYPDDSDASGDGDLSANQQHCVRYYIWNFKCSAHCQ